MNYSQVKAAFQCKEDSTTKYKRCGHYIVQLFKLPETLTNENRKNVKNSMLAKFRGSQFLCGKILNTEHGCFVVQIKHKWHSTEITYKTGEVVIPDRWTADIEEICSHGIHFFNCLLAAYLYELSVFRDDGGVARTQNVRCPEHRFNCDCFLCTIEETEALQEIKNFFER